jgi:hypothetical protein
MMNHPKRLHPRRHVFHGHATGVAAHIRRPQDAVLSVQGSSALPVIGGHCESRVGPTTLGQWVSFESIETSAHGDYADAEEGVKTTRGEVAFDAAETHTRVSARVRGLAILGRVHIADLQLGMFSRNAPGTAQPSIRLEGNRLEGLRIDDSPLTIELAEDFYCEHHTYDRFKAAFNAGLPDQHHRMFLPANLKGEQEEVKTFPESQGVVKCSIVRHLDWAGAKHRDATITGHVVEIPNFGKVYFGEMFVTSQGRHLTMVRFQLGSDAGGEVTGGTGGSGDPPGQTFPPTGG